MQAESIDAARRSGRPAMVAILVTDGFERAELSLCRRALENTGVTVHIVSDKPERVKSGESGGFRSCFSVDKTLDRVAPEFYDGVLLPGGAANADTMCLLPSARKFIQALNRLNKPIAAIGEGVRMLVAADVVKDRNLSGCSSLKSAMERAGANWLDVKIVSDENIVSAKDLKGVTEFNAAFVSVLDEYLTSTKETGKSH